MWIVMIVLVVLLAISIVGIIVTTRLQRNKRRTNPESLTLQLIRTDPHRSNAGAQRTARAAIPPTPFPAGAPAVWTGEPLSVELLGFSGVGARRRALLGKGERRRVHWMRTEIVIADDGTPQVDVYAHNGRIGYLHPRRNDHHDAMKAIGRGNVGAAPVRISEDHDDAPEAILYLGEYAYTPTPPWEK